MTARSPMRSAAGALAVLLAATLLAAVPAAASSVPAATIESGGNPILADGSAYSADAAPLVVEDDCTSMPDTTRRPSSKPRSS